MKVIYEFSEDDDDRRQIFEKARQFFSALWDIAEGVRGYRKHGNRTEEELLDEIMTSIEESGMWEIP